MSPALGSRYGDHPMVKYVRSLPGEFYLTREVADMLDVSEDQLVHLRRHAHPPLGPTHRAQYGGVTLYLYSAQRAAEIAERVKTTRGAGRPSLWTKTESTRRRRDRIRARNYRVRAAKYTEQGQLEQAARMQQMNDDLLAELDKAKRRRWKQVHGTAYRTPT